MKNESLYIKFLIIGILLCLAGPIWAHTEELMAKRRFEKMFLNMSARENFELIYRNLDMGSAILGKFNGNRKGLWCCSVGAAMVAGSLFGLSRIQKNRLDKLENLLVTGSQQPAEIFSVDREAEVLIPWQEARKDDLTDTERKLLFQMETGGRHDGLFHAVSFGFPCLLIIAFSLKNDHLIGVFSGIITYVVLRLWFVLQQDAMTPQISSAIKKIRKQSQQTVSPNPPASGPVD